MSLIYSPIFEIRTDPLLKKLIISDLAKRTKQLKIGHGYHFVTRMIDYMVDYEDTKKLLIIYARWNKKPKS